MTRPATRTAAKLVLIVAALAMSAACGGRDASPTTTAPPTTAAIASTTTVVTTTPPPPSTSSPTTTTSTLPPTTVSPLFAVIAGFTGEWTGEWVNTTFGSSGPILVLLDVVDDQTFSLTADLDGLVFGQTNPDPEQWIVAVADLAGPLTIQSTTFGELTLIVSLEGARITAGDVPAAGIQSFQLDAGFEPGPRIVGSYLVGFEDGSVAEGTAELQRIEP